MSNFWLFPNMVNLKPKFTTEAKSFFLLNCVPDAAVVVLLQTGLQLGHLGHRGRSAGARNALQIADS